MEPQHIVGSWQLIGLVLAVVLVFASGVAYWTRWAHKAKLQGQTIWHVVVGVTGVVFLAGFVIGFESAGFVLICFVMSFFPMAYEYFERLKQEEAEAQKVREEAVDGNTSPDRQTGV